ncbi:hypothetical protein [Streptomyces xanthophaeus]|uniref:hypothetical protein n=1 Tax=Streptomyces xanthophaeus TaxID=67385 RepID=UPI0026497871|nr:hypothetical protein [Streptomyces xanthophaeus]WKD34118.1 hypothetical protein KO717_20575 [Streptomyces xanthophaeus]
MSTLATRIAKTAAAAVIAACAVGVAHSFATGEPSPSRHSSVSAFDFGTVTIPLDPSDPRDKSDITDVTWGH